MFKHVNTYFILKEGETKTYLLMESRFVSASGPAFPEKSMNNYK